MKEQKKKKIVAGVVNYLSSVPRLLSTFHNLPTVPRWVGQCVYIYIYKYIYLSLAIKLGNLGDILLLLLLT